MIVLAAVVVCLTAGLIVVWRERSTDRLIHDRRLDKIVVELHSGDTFEGVLLAVDRKSVVLGLVSAIHGAETVPTKIDGTLLVPRGDLKFLQRP